MEKKNKRIRYPKKKEQKQEQQEEQKKHFVLDVHDVITSSKNAFGK